MLQYISLRINGFFYINCSGKWYALKILEKAEVVRKNAIDQVINEKNLLSELHNPFLVNMFYAFTDNECCYMILDLCLGGDLRYYLYIILIYYFYE